MAYQEEINRRLKTIARQQREMQKCMDGGDSSSTDALLEQILQELQNTPQLESPDFKSFCLDGVLTGSVAYLYDEASGAITELYLDSQGLPTTTRPSGGLCPPEIDYEFKHIITEKCLPTGEGVKEILCLTFENGVEVGSSIHWLVGGVRLTTDPGVVDCVNPEYQILDIRVCFESGVAGYTLIKVDTTSDTVFPLGSYYLDGTPSTENTTTCPEVEILTSELCEI